MKRRVILVTSILLMNVLFLLPSLIFTPVKSLDYGMDQDLGNVNASFLGEDTDDFSGFSVAGAGDVNGDGYDDILIGARGNDESGDEAGQIYLIFGKSSDWSMDTDLSKSNASFLGEDAHDFSGCSVAGAGDVNGDGYDDILIGAKYNEEGGNEAGQTYLILGKESGWAMDTDLSASAASFWGEDQYDRSGCSVAGAGDVNGDGYDDILIGAFWERDGGDRAGQTYLILGKASGWSIDTDLSASDASLLGEGPLDFSGSSVAGAGDVNGDGYDDILIGAYYDDDGGDHAGQTYLILGKASGWAMDVDLSASDASFWGEAYWDWSGCSVAGAGDVNGDGYDDILIGAPSNNEVGNSAGQTYLILGKASGWAMDTNLSASDASFLGVDACDYSGRSVTGAGDVNGDGYDDILIGEADVGNAGCSHLILGKASGWTMDIDLSSSDASFEEECANDYLLLSVACAGDVNGDGYDDILIGAPGNDDSGNYSGQTYLILSGYNFGPRLYFENLSLSNSHTPTNITFSIMYKDIDDDEPVNISLVIDNNWHDMISNDSIPFDFKKGVRYSCTLNLTEGIHQYYYSASDGKAIVRLPLNGYLIPTDQDGDGIPDSLDTDRDGDGADNIDDAYPDDPTIWESDKVSDPDEFFSILKWVGLIVLIILVVVLCSVIYVVWANKIDESDDLGRVEKEE